MNLILNREINGYTLPERVKIIAAMNPSSKYGPDLDYRVVDMDVAQENRFVWLYMEPDYVQWLDWAVDAGLEPKVIEFISTFPEYLLKINEDDIMATPRSYERISSLYQIYQQQKDSVPRSVFLNVLRGNVGKLIAEAFVSFAESDCRALISFEEVFAGNSLPAEVLEKIKSESHTRLYLSAKNILKTLEATILKGDADTRFFTDRLIAFLQAYPVDLRIGIMKDIKNSYPGVYSHALENESFVESYFEAYRSTR